MQTTDLPFDAVIESPVGRLGIKVFADKLQAINFLPKTTRLKKPTDTFTGRVVKELHCYFSDPKHSFTIPLHLSGTTFQEGVWTALTKISSGTTYSYGELAKKLKTAPRAIGNGCRTNPIVIVIPCHRIVSQMGIGGFNGARSGNWLKIKKWLLEHEGALPRPVARLKIF